MSDEHDGKTHAVAQVVHQVDDLCLDGHVKCADRLVGDDEIGAQDDCARDADTLTLAAGEFVRITLCMFGDKANLGENRGNLLVNELLVVDSANPETFRDYLADGHTRVKGADRILEYHLDLCHQLLVDFGIGLKPLELGAAGFNLFGGLGSAQRLLCLCDLLFAALPCSNAHADANATEVDAAVGHVIKADNGTAGGGLSAAGFANQTEDLALANFKADIVNSLGSLEILLHVLNPEDGFLVRVEVGSVIIHSEFLIEF